MPIYQRMTIRLNDLLFLVHSIVDDNGLETLEELFDCLEENKDLMVLYEDEY